MSRSPDLFTAADVARFCEVDLKTIHNWAARGKVPHHKTDGNHVRVHRVDLVAFLRRYEMPLPEDLRHGRPAVAVIGADEGEVAALQRALQKRFEVETHEDPIDALVAIGASPPEVAVVCLPVVGIDLSHALTRLRGMELTAHVRVILIGEEAIADLDDASVFVPREKQSATAARVREILEEMTGLA